MENVITLNQLVKKKVVSNALKIKNSPVSQITKEYLSLEEFRTQAHELVKNFCNKHGIS